MAQPSSSCSIKACTLAAVATGISFGKPLCQKHFDKDIEKLQKRQSKLKQRCQVLKEELGFARIEVERLSAEMQEAEDLFDAAIESLMKSKEAVLRRLTVRHEIALQELRDLTVIDEYETAVTEAETENNLREVFELTSEMELQCNDLEEIVRKSTADSVTDGGCADVALRSVGDVSGGLRDLQREIDRQMKTVMQLCESADAALTSNKICEPLREIENLDADPMWVTACSNTAGFVGDSSGRVMKAESAGEGGVQLPEPCLFVSFYEENNMKDHLLALSTDGSVRLRCHCDIDWTKFVSGLHCDSKRQQLFVSQPDSVTVTDLSGRVSRVMNASSLGQSVGYFGGIDGNSDKVFVFDQQEKKVLGIGKDSGELQTVIGVSSFCGDFKYATGISVLGNKIMLTDWSNKQVHKVCISSKQLISSFPRMDQTKFESTISVSTSSSGLVFISDFFGNSVVIQSSDGRVLQTMKDKGGYGYGLVLVSGGSPLLAVVRKGSKAISVYSVSK